MTLNHAQCTMTKITGADLVPTHTTIGDTSLEDSKEASLGNSDCTTSPYDVTNTHVELVQPRSATSFYRFGSFFCSFVLLSFFAHCDISLFGTIHVNWFSLFVSWRSEFYIPHTFLHSCTSTDRHFINHIYHSVFFVPSGGFGSLHVTVTPVPAVIVLLRLVKKGMSLYFNET